MKDNTTQDQRAESTERAQSEQATPCDHQPTHRNFRWIDSATPVFADAMFLERTLDIAVGINTCLEIVYASNLERAANDDADAGTTAPPAVGVVEADHLMRLAMAASALLSDSARQRIESVEEIT